MKFQEHRFDHINATTQATEKLKNLEFKFNTEMSSTLWLMGLKLWELWKQLRFGWCWTFLAALSQWLLQLVNLGERRKKIVLYNLNICQTFFWHISIHFVIIFCLPHSQESCSAYTSGRNSVEAAFDIESPGENSVLNLLSICCKKYNEHFGIIKNKQVFHLLLLIQPICFFHLKVFTEPEKIFCLLFQKLYKSP